MSESKFKVGDRVAVNRKYVGTIKRIFPSEEAKYIYVIAYKGNAGTAWEKELEDVKTAFLSELKGLLSKYDAMIIGGGYEGYGDYLQIQLGLDEPFSVGECSEYGDRCTLTADNIMNYKKTNPCE